jgi:hypothetical protein
MHGKRRGQGETGAAQATEYLGFGQETGVLEFDQSAGWMEKEDTGRP